MSSSPDEAKQRELRIKWTAFRLRLMHVAFKMPVPHIILTLAGSKMDPDELKEISDLLVSTEMKMTPIGMNAAMGMISGLKGDPELAKKTMEDWLREILSGQISLPDDDFINRVTAIS